LLQLRDEAFQAAEREKSVAMKSTAQEMQEEEKAAKLASDVRLKQLRENLEAQESEKEHKQRLETIRAEEEAARAELPQRVLNERSEKILAFLVSPRGKALTESIGSQSKAVEEQLRKERKPLDEAKAALDKDVKAMSDPAVLVGTDKKDWQDAMTLRLLEYDRAAREFKESSKLSDMRRGLAEKLAEFKEGCGCTYEEAMAERAKSLKLAKPETSR
jgi:hypothetical protein